MSGAAGLYSCFDFRLQSDVPLPELHAAAPDDARPVVTLTLGVRDWPADLAEGALARREDCVWFSVAGVGRFEIVAGHAIRVSPAREAEADLVRLFLLGSALGVLCLQRGLLLLHANAVVIGGAAIAFAGHSGAGKSTLAAMFERAGHEVLCDDVFAIGFDKQGRPVTWPGLPRLKLGPEAIEALGHSPMALRRIADGLAKYHVPLTRQGRPRPVPVSRLYLLERAAAGAESRIAPLAGAPALQALLAQRYRPGLPARLGLAEQSLRHCAKLVEQVRMFTLLRRWGLDAIDDDIAMIAAHVTGPAVD